MEFRTKLPAEPLGISLTHKDKLFVTGSCFAENTGVRLREHGFHVLLNPFGVLYNPFSICLNLERLLQHKPFDKTSLVFRGELYHSFSHHGSFSGPDADQTLQAINASFSRAAHALQEATCLIVTFGTAWIYTRADTNEVVANCHQFPASFFNRSRLTVEAIVERYTSLIQQLQYLRPDLKIILTVSPIRHLKDGFQENSLSKAILQLACEEMTSSMNQVYYYPSYELMMDDLRDYRFYDVDMVHPSSVALEYIWEHFSATFFTKTTREIARQVAQLHKAMEHRPFHPEGEAFERFVKKNIATIELLALSQPDLDLKREKAFFEKMLER